jgi:hypothetical protein
LINLGAPLLYFYLVAFYGPLLFSSHFYFLRFKFAKKLFDLQPGQFLINGPSERIILSAPVGLFKFFIFVSEKGLEGLVNKLRDRSINIAEYKVCP